MSESYKVTIGITCFNSENTIANAIESALLQTHDNTEILIVDDGSSDSSIDIIREYANAHQKIRFIPHEKNLGAPTAYNTLATHATGKYLCFFDGDDVAHADRVEKTSQALEVYDGLAVCFCDRYVSSQEGRVIQGLKQTKISNAQFLEYMLDALCYHYDPQYYAKSYSTFQRLRQHGLAGSSAGSGIMTVPTKAFKACLFDTNMYRCWDTEWNVRIAAQGYTAINVDIPLMTQHITDSVEKTHVVEKRCLYYALSKHSELFSQYNLYYPRIHFIDNSFYIPSPLVEDESQPLVTIGMLTYNCADHIIESLESALFQTYRNTEIVVVDDASTDDTIQLVKAFNDPRITFIESSINRGAGYNRNVVIDHAKGEYLIFFDDDDVALPNRVESQINVLKKYENKTSQPLISIADFYHYAGGFLGPRHSTHHYEEHIQTQALRRLLWHVILMHSESRYLLIDTGVVDAPYALGTGQMCAKTSVFKAVRFDPEFRRMQDLEFLVRFAQNMGGIVNKREPVFHIYATPGSEKKKWKVVDCSTKIFAKHPNEAAELFGFDTQQIISRNNLKSKLLKRMDTIKQYL